MAESFRTTQLHRLLARYQAGDRTAWDELYDLAGKRLKALAHRMLRRFPRVHGFEETDDVVQNATVRLLRALKIVQPGSVQQFFALASTQIRRELLDMIDKIGGPNGPAVPQPIPKDMVPDGGPSPQELEEWTEFHRQIEELPPGSRKSSTCTSTRV